MNDRGPIALVPMKGHSARVPKKNLRPFCGAPLYHRIVASLQSSRHVEEVVIETDSDEIAADVQRNFDVRLLRRPDRLVGDEVPMNALIEFHLSQLDGEFFLQTHSTNPLLTPETIDEAIETFWQLDATYDSLFSVNKWQRRLYWENGDSINHNPEELLPTQDLPPIFEENSNLYLFSKQSFAKRARRIGESPFMFPMSALEAIDIDEMEDFVIAESLMQRRMTESDALSAKGPTGSGS